MDNNLLYGLIGYPLSHSFSQRYFTDMFVSEGLLNYSYRNFPISNIRELPDIISKNTALQGFNVTIPYKEQIIPYIDELDHVATKVGAVNTVQVIRNGGKNYLKGYNTDVYGFSSSLEEWISLRGVQLPKQALVLGTGGASKAVAYALFRLNIEVHFISRNAGTNIYKTYEKLEAADMSAHQLIVNTSPVGMFPAVDQCPDIPYQHLNGNHFLYDLIYNPEETLFMRKGKEMGAAARNGERMLYLQADKAWEIWQGNLDEENKKLG